MQQNSRRGSYLKDKKGKLTILWRNFYSSESFDCHRYTHILPFSNNRIFLALIKYCRYYFNPGRSYVSFCINDCSSMSNRVIQQQIYSNKLWRVNKVASWNLSQSIELDAWEEGQKTPQLVGLEKFLLDLAQYRSRYVLIIEKIWESSGRFHSLKRTSFGRCLCW